MLSEPVTIGFMKNTVITFSKNVSGKGEDTLHNLQIGIRPRIDVGHAQAFEILGVSREDMNSLITALRNIRDEFDA